MHWQYGGEFKNNQRRIATQLQFQQTNNAKQQNKQRALVTLVICGSALDEQ